MTDNLTLVVYNVNRALQELTLHCEQIDDAMESLKELKKSILHNISVAKQSMEALYNAERNIEELPEEPLRFLWRDVVL
jgi:hypothetical protein